MCNRALSDKEWAVKFILKGPVANEYKTIQFVANSIMEQVNLWVRFPITLADVNRATEERFKFPTFIGVIDRTQYKNCKTKCS